MNWAALREAAGMAVLAVFYALLWRTRSRHLPCRGSGAMEAAGLEMAGPASITFLMVSISRAAIGLGAARPPVWVQGLAMTVVAVAYVVGTVRAVGAFRRRSRRLGSNP